MKRHESQPRFDQLLDRLHAGIRWRVLRRGLLLFGGLGGGAVLAAAWAVGGDPRPGGFISSALTVSLGVGLGSLLWRFILRPLRAHRRQRDLVRHIEAWGDFANVLVAAEEARRIPGRWEAHEPVRRALLDRLFEQAHSVVDFLRPEDVLPLKHWRVGVASAVGCGVLLVLMMVLVPQELTRGLTRLVRPLAEAELVPTSGMFAVGDGTYVVAGEAVEVAAHDFAAGEQTAVCEIRTGSGLWQAVPVQLERVYADELGLPPSYRRWTAHIEDVREDFAWRYRRDALVTAVREVKVRHHPLVTGLAARVEPPAYTRMAVQELSRLPSWFEVPAGSILHLTGAVNHPVNEAVLVFADGDTLALTTDSLTVLGRLEVRESLSFEVDLQDRFGLRNQSPLGYEIAAAVDQPPAVRLERPDDDGILPISGNLDLLVEAADDFGMRDLRLLIRTVTDSGAPVGRDTAEDSWDGGAFWSAATRSSSGWQTLATAGGPVQVRTAYHHTGVSGLRLQLGLEVDAGALDIVAGDAVELLIEAVDNRQPGPPGVSRSQVLRLVLPSAAEVLAEEAESGERRQSELEEMRRRGRELGADLDRLTRELLKNPVPDWARQQEMEVAIQRQQAMQKELSRVAEQLRQNLDQLAQSQLTSQSLVDKAEEVNQLLTQSGSEELQDLLDKMEQAQGQVSPEDVAKAMEEVARNQQEMARRLDAALAMLKRMSQEQELEGLASLLEKMIQKQQELADLSRQLEEQRAAAEAAADEDGQDSQDGEPQEGESQEGESQEGESQEGESQEGESQEGESQEGESQEGESQEGESQEGDPTDGESPSGDPSPEDQALPTPEELARRQEALARELEQLQERMEEALAELKEEQENGEQSPSDQQMQKAMEQALENLEKQNSQGNMDQASQMLQEMDPQQAAQLQQQTLRDLGALYHVLIETQQAMQMAMQMHQVTSLRRLAADMLAISTRQEEIAGRIPAQLRNIRSLDLTRSQHRLQKATDGVRSRLAELLDESPTRIMKLLDKLDDLIEAMGHAVQAMEDNRGPVARRGATESLAEANRIVISLLTEAQISSSSSGGSGGGSSSPSLSEQLKEMAKQQAGLNGMTEELRRMLANRGISQAARAQMKRLGEAQGDLAGRVAELEEEHRGQPEGERLLGDLGELGEQMERISGEIDQGLVSEETLERQERILSRLLDARNSVRRRDYTSKRESNTASRLYDEQQGRTGDADNEDPDSPFRLRYLPLEKAPLEYRDLVRRYFTALDSLRLLEQTVPDLGIGRGELP